MEVRRLLPVLAASLAVAAPVRPFAATSHRDRSAADKAQIARLEQDWLGAIRTGDRGALQAMLADDFTDIDAQGEVRDKHDAIAYSAAPAHTSQTITQLQVRVWGDTAVATGINRVHSSDKGWTVDVMFTDTFARMHGEWRAVSSQETLRRDGARAKPDS